MSKIPDLTDKLAVRNFMYDIAFTFETKRIPVLFPPPLFPEKELKMLRQANRKNAVISVALVVLVVVIYTCWTM